MANKERGETKVSLKGKEYVMRPTFEALCNIEDKIGTGILSLARRVEENADMRVKDMAAIIHEGIKGAGGQIEEREIGRLIVEAGFYNYVKPVLAFLKAAMNVGGEGSAEGGPKNA